MSKENKNIDLCSPKVFEGIYNTYWKKVYSICYNNTRQSEAAREMVQDIFKSLWERRFSLSIENIEHYLIKAAKLKVFEYIRNESIKLRHHDCIFVDSCPNSNCTEEEIFFNQLSDQVDMLIDRLPCQCKKVFNMSRREYLTNKEIASALLISERAVEYHISKAVKFLKENLTEFNRPGALN